MLIMRMRGLLLSVGAIIGACAVAAPAQGATPISRFGVYTFSDLGYPTRTVRAAHLQDWVSIVSFRLPPGASERAGHWYLLHLHVRADVGRSHVGRAYIVVGDRLGAAEIRVDVGSGGAVEWSAVGYVNGTQQKTSKTGTFAVRFVNVMPYKAIRPGANTLRLMVEDFGAKVSQVTVYGDSSLEYTPDGPANVVIVAHADARPKVGRPLHVSVTLTNRGQRAARKITLTSNSAGEPISLQGPVARQVADLAPGQSRTVTMTFVPAAGGLSRLFFLASTTANQPGTEVDINTAGAVRAPSAPSQGPPSTTPVRSAGGGPGMSLWRRTVYIVAAVLATAGLGVGGRAAWRRRRPGDARGS